MAIVNVSVAEQKKDGKKCRAVIILSEVRQQLSYWRRIYTRNALTVILVWLTQRTLGRIIEPL